MSVLQPESVSGNCTKFHTEAASNNRDHMSWSLYSCLFVPHWVLFFVHILFVVNRTFHATPTERLQHLECTRTWNFMESRYYYAFSQMQESFPPIGLW